MSGGLTMPLSKDFYETDLRKKYDLEYIEAVILFCLFEKDMYEKEIADEIGKSRSMVTYYKRKIKEKFGLESIMAIGRKIRQEIKSLEKIG